MATFYKPLSVKKLEEGRIELKAEKTFGFFGRHFFPVPVLFVKTNRQWFQNQVLVTNPYLLHWLEDAKRSFLSS